MLRYMTDSFPHNRSPEMMSADDTAMIVVDVQEKLIPLVPNASRIVWNIERLLEAAKTLGVPCFGTEQYPKGLGPTVEPLRSRLAEMHEKLAFSCVACRELVEQLEQQLRKITQSHLDMDGRRVTNMGRAVYVKDAVTLSQLRGEIDALRREIETKIDSVRKGI